MTTHDFKEWDEIEANMNENKQPGYVRDYERAKKKVEAMKEGDDPAQVSTTTKKVYNPATDEIPPTPEPVIFLNETSILTYNNVTGIIAHPGSGKSAVCEAVCSAVLNKANNDIDTLGFSIGKEISKAVYIDCERTNIDVYNSFCRMLRRCNLPKEHKPDNVTFAGLRLVVKLEERLQVIQELIDEHKPDLLIIDGAADLVTDINSIEQSLDVKIKFREWTSKNNLSIFTTLHPNPGSTKPRGHIGSEIMREAENVLFIEKVDDVQRNITTDFAHGKSRNNGAVTTSFTWDDKRLMFVSCEVKQPTGKKLDASKVLQPQDYFNILTEIKERDKTTATEFHEYLKVLLSGFDNVKTGDKAIRDFIGHLIRMKFIDKIGTRNKRTIEINENELKKYIDNTKQK